MKQINIYSRVIKNFIYIVLVYIFINCFLCVNAYAEEDRKSLAEYLSKAVEFFNINYAGNVDNNILLENALKGIFNSGDKYTVYLTKSETDEMMKNIEGKYEGIGVQLLKINKYVTIVEVFPGSPAEETGLLCGDQIIKVSGKSVEDLNVEDVVDLILGKAGTNVNISVLRGGNEEKIFTITRRELEINPVKYEIRNGNIGYIKLYSFSSNSSDKLLEALNYMDNMQVNKIVLDLRNNPGGEVNQAVNIARRFIPEGIITRLDFKSDEYKDLEYYSYLKGSKYKLAVLVNNMSASASEIFAGAVQDRKAGVLVGTKTFGKAKVQNIIPILSPQAYDKYKEKYQIESIDMYEAMRKIKSNIDDTDIIGSVKITTGYYYTPSGKNIDGIGLEPDIYIENSSNMQIDLNNMKRLPQVKKYKSGDWGKDVYYAELILKEKGYNIQNADFLLDENTFFEIAKFQKDNGLFPYGVMDFSTQRKLNEALEQIINEKDLQYAAALKYLLSEQ